MSIFYFIQPVLEQTLSEKWFEKIPATSDVILSDRLYKTSECLAVTETPLSFILHTGTIEHELKTSKPFKMVELDPGFRFYFDHEYGFLESEEERLDDAIQVFLKLLSPTRKESLIFFFSAPVVLEDPNIT